MAKNHGDELPANLIFGAKAEAFLDAIKVDTVA